MSTKITLKQFKELLSQAESKDDIKGFFEICDLYPEAFEELQVEIDREMVLANEEMRDLPIEKYWNDFANRYLKE